MKDHYEAVLADLQKRKSKLEMELREIDVMIGGLQRLIGDEPPPAMLVASPQPSPSAIELAEAFNKLPGVNGALLASSSRFSNISVQWGVIWYLAEDVEGFATTAEVAIRLLAGGYRSHAEPFPNVVSGVLSEMKTNGDVETSEDGGYRLTEQGRQTWESIRHSSEFRYATNEALMLGVQ